MSAAVAFPVGPADEAFVVRSVGHVFADYHRSRREPARSYQPDRLPSLWCAWERTRDEFAREVADCMVNSWTASLPERLAQYKLAVERHNKARARYYAAHQAKPAAGA